MSPRAKLMVTVLVCFIWIYVWEGYGQLRPKMTGRARRSITKQARGANRSCNAMRTRLGEREKRGAFASRCPRPQLNAVVDLGRVRGRLLCHCAGNVVGRGAATPRRARASSLTSRSIEVHASRNLGNANLAACWIPASLNLAQRRSSVAIRYMASANWTGSSGGTRTPQLP